MRFRRFWWRDWREAYIWRILAVAIPVAVGVVTVVMVGRYR